MALKFAKQVVVEFTDDQCPMMAASLAFYAVFSIPPLLFLLVHGVGALLGASQAEAGLIEQTGQLFGPAAAAQFSAMLKNAAERSAGEGSALVISLAALVFAATGGFIQLQAALNRVWQVQPSSNHPFVVAYLARRGASMLMMAALGVFLLVSLGLSTLLAAAGELFLAGMREDTLRILDLMFNAAVLTALFAAMFRWIPDGRILWRDVWVGAFVTAGLFMAAKYGAALYLGGGEPGQPFAATGSLTVFMMWVYFAAAALLLGAEFTQVWVRRSGREIEPVDGAVRVTVTTDEPTERETLTRLDI
ncbi:MAG: YihY/virulence factor BrkB family protein [Acidobacteria bacterium]|nr:YihY/virulence factor BrkB family protein [Acidobacteriota bacterium]MDA1234935.1 YihY/virulence factor BrkB family protein [Acidobacteriota bacterium]